METQKLTRGSLSLGAILVMFGLIFLAVTTGVAGLNWSNVWPAFLLMFGIEPVLQAILDREVSPRRRGWTVASS
jgi:hypothetical protein